MIKLDKTRVKRLTAIHGWSGVALGWLLYAVIFTGSVAVFADEIGAWSMGGQKADAPLSQPIDGALRRLAAETDPAFLEEIGVSYTAAGEQRLFFHEHRKSEDGEIRDYGVQYVLDPTTGDVTRRSVGYAEDIVAADRAGALEDFIVDLHVQLYAPEPWGLILTGVLGLAMMTAAVSGLLMHRHAIRDLFVAERPGDRLVSARDRHVLAGVWGLPFGFMLAFTGSFFSFAISLGLPIVTMVSFGGDQQKMFEALVGHQPPSDSRPAPLANVDYIVADGAARADAPANFVLIERFGRADASVTTFHEAPEGGLVGPRYRFDGVSRAFEGELPTIGSKPSAGSAAVSLMGPLHFGDFAGTPSKIVWAALGAAMCFVTLSGLRLWLRRRSDDPLWARFRIATTVVGWGLPLAMTASAYAYFLSAPAGDPIWWTPAGFVLGAALAITVGWSRGAAAEPILRRLLGLALAGAPILRLATGGASWAEAMIEGLAWVVSVDVALVVLGVAVLAWRAKAAPARVVTAPAE